MSRLEGLTLTIDHHLGDLNRFARGKTREFWFYAAYVTWKEVAAVRDLIASAEKVHGIFGACPLTDPEALRELQQRGAVVGLIRLCPGTELQPEWYMGIGADGQAWAALGSANLTGRGAGADVELLVTVTGSQDHPFMADLRDWLQEVERFSAPLTSDLLQALHQVQRAHALAAPATDPDQADMLNVLAESGSEARQEQAETMPRSLTATAAELARRLHEEALVHYIRTTRLFASYKLVVLGLLLQAPDGRLTLSECARRFHRFYLTLQAAGQQPERASGSLPPAMLHPERLTQAEVESLLLQEPRQAFHRSGRVVVFHNDGQGWEVFIARPLWVATAGSGRERTLAAVLERLEAYYLTHTGSARAVRQALVGGVSPENFS